MQIKGNHSIGARMAVNAVSNNLSNGKTRTKPLGQSMGNRAGAQCKVTISREGKWLSAQTKQESAPKQQLGQVERALLRRQKQDSDYKEEHSRLVNEIASLKNTLHNTGAVGDKETIERKQQALEKLENLKELQEEENRQRLKAAAGGLAGISKEQGEIDKSNSELYMMLKSFEEEDEDSEGQGDSNKTDSAKETPDEMESMGEKTRQSAAMLGVSAARREMASADVVEELKQEGLDMLAEVTGLMNEITAGLKEAEEIMSDTGRSEAERLQLASEAVERSRGVLAGSAADMIQMRGRGLQRLQDARELKLKRIQIDPLQNVAAAQQSMTAMADRQIIGEAAEKLLSKASQELADRVREEIDKRNDILPDTGEEEELAEKLRQEEEETAKELRQEEQEALEKRTAQEQAEIAVGQAQK
ncbi:MAG: hypothetical protein NC337_03585 [Roseburia sp.]|nr:hypothetical protein [Roseburia sp.]